MTYEVKLKIAMDNHNNIIVINDANSRKTYKCFECKERVIPKKGEIKQHHFSHFTNSLCNGETHDHLYAKELLKKYIKKCILKSCSFCKNKIDFDYENIKTQDEYKYGDFRIDVMVFKDNNEFCCIEVKNTSPISEKKLIFFNNNSIKFCEIQAKDIINANLDEITDKYEFNNCNKDYFCEKCNNNLKKINKNEKYKKYNQHKKLEIYYNSIECNCGISKINICHCSNPNITESTCNKWCQSCRKWLCRC